MTERTADGAGGARERRRGGADPGSPWWSSGNADGIGDQDPLAAFVDAARSLHDGPARGDRSGGADHGHATVEACEVCPVCTLVRVVGQARPEVVEHLAEAVRHVTLAARAVLEVEAEERGPEGLERIELDDD